MNELEIIHQKEDNCMVVRVLNTKSFTEDAVAYFVPKLAAALVGNC